MGTLEEEKEVLHYASQNITSLTRIMLDNMVVPLSDGDVDVSMLEEAVKLISEKFKTEASGSVTLQTIHKIGQTGVTYISKGSWFHMDYGLPASVEEHTWDVAITQLSVKLGF